MRAHRIPAVGWVVIPVLSAGGASAADGGTNGHPLRNVDRVPHMERRTDPPHAGPGPVVAGVQTGRAHVERNGFISVQVNVDANGNNIPGDAANEPSMAIDATNPDVIVIGWRQFDTVVSNFRQAGWGYSHDGGQNWTFPGVLEPGVFRSDPVLGADANGTLYYYSLRTPSNFFVCDMFRSTDGGVSWQGPYLGYGGDKAWLAIDRTAGPGRGSIYVVWSPFAGCCGLDVFSHSRDGGITFTPPVALPGPTFAGTLDVGPDGTLYIVGAPSGSASRPSLTKSENIQFNEGITVFSGTGEIDIGGLLASSFGPNPGGLLGQFWVATDHSNRSTRGNVYVMASVNPDGPDELDVMFVRSEDGGSTWSDPVRINDDPADNGAWQWHATMSVAPTGRIDVVWNDTRGDPTGVFSELYYARSTDGGRRWSVNEPVSPAFNHFLGYPNQGKLGDYYDMASDEIGVGVAYAATFNGEQDVYYLRINGLDCNGNGIPDTTDLEEGTSRDCDGDLIPDDCDPDCNNNGDSDICELLAGTTDCDGNRIPDDCQPNLDGDDDIDECDLDLDGDGVRNVDDRCLRTPVNGPAQQLGEPMGDFDRNCRLDLSDYSQFAACIDIGGPGAIRPAMLGCFDYTDADGDFDIDLLDAAWFLRLFDRPDRTSPP